MRDPDMVFEVYASPTLATAEPLSFRNDYMGLMQEIYRYDDDGKKTHVNAKWKKEFKTTPRHGFKPEGSRDHKGPSSQVGAPGRSRPGAPLLSLARSRGFVLVRFHSCHPEACEIPDALHLQQISKLSQRRGSPHERVLHLC